MPKSELKPQTLDDLLRSSKDNLEGKQVKIGKDGELQQKVMSDILHPIPGTGYGKTQNETWLIQNFIMSEYFRNKGIRVVLYRLYAVLFALQIAYPQYFQILQASGLPHSLWTAGAAVSLFLAGSEMFLMNFMYGQDGELDFALQFFVPTTLHKEYSGRKEDLSRSIKHLGLHECVDYSEENLAKLMRSKNGPSIWNRMKSKKRD
jgi:hypothetical protein